ncbi:MAG TPA: glycosyltransferase family 39 protein [Pseudomonadales bacterium]|nr:glycosyltransferase family 39 protein [Pseudomonadales bacterium]
MTSAGDKRTSILVTAGLWLCLAVLFIALRFDNSERIYFAIDDQVVVWLVDDIVSSGNWQPDWYRTADKRHTSAYFASEAQRTEIPHAHHYNFTAHILLSSAAIKIIRTTGCDTPTIVLLHHIALFWDTISWLLLISIAFRFGGMPLALSSALIYSVFPLTVQGSHYARPDAFLTCMGTALLWLAMNTALSRLQHWRWLLLNGLVLGAATAGKASQLMLGIFPALAASQQCLLARQHRNLHDAVRIIGDGLVLAAITALVLGFMFYIANIAPEDFWISLQSIQRYYQHPGPPELLEHYSFTGQLLTIARYFLATSGWPLVIAMLLGILSLARCNEKFPLLLLVLPIFFFTGYFASVPAFFDRSFCALAAAMTLLAAIGSVSLLQQFRHIPAMPLLTVLITALVCYQPVVIQYHLQGDHLRSHHNDHRLAFQQQLKKDFSAKTGIDFWLKNIDRSDLFSQSLPQKPENNRRIYVAEDLNDWNSRVYLQKLRDNGFVQIAVYHGDFADMPTNSLITVHEAARFYYFVRGDEVAVPDQFITR